MYAQMDTQSDDRSDRQGTQEWRWDKQTQIIYTRELTDIYKRTEKSQSGFERQKIKYLFTDIIRQRDVREHYRSKVTLARIRVPGEGLKFSDEVCNAPHKSTIERFHHCDRSTAFSFVHNSIDSEELAHHAHAVAISTREWVIIRFWQRNVLVCLDRNECTVLNIDIYVKGQDYIIGQLHY